MHNGNRRLLRRNSHMRLSRLRLVDLGEIEDQKDPIVYRRRLEVIETGEVVATPRYPITKQSIISRFCCWSAKICDLLARRKRQNSIKNLTTTIPADLLQVAPRR